MGNLQKLKRNQVWWQKSTNKQTIPGIQNDKRPVVIVSNDACNKFSQAITVIPLTTAVKKDLPVHVKLLMADGKTVSTVLCEQIKTVPAESLIDYIGTIEEDTMDAINKAMLKALGLLPITEPPEETKDHDIIELAPDTNVETKEEEVTDTDVGDPSTKSRAKRFNRRETKLIRDYLKYHTTAETSKYFAQIYDMEYNKIYPRICNIKYKTKSK